MQPLGFCMRRSRSILQAAATLTPSAAAAYSAGNGMRGMHGGICLAWNTDRSSVPDSLRMTVLHKPQQLPAAAAANR